MEQHLPSKRSGDIEKERRPTRKKDKGEEEAQEEKKEWKKERTIKTNTTTLK